MQKEELTLDHLRKFEKDLTNEEEMAVAVQKYLAANNDPKYNFSKAQEECFELGEKISKRNNKIDSYKPPLSEIVEELGDVLQRTCVLFLQETQSEEEADDLLEGVVERIEVKSRKLLMSILSGKYGNRI